MIQSQAEAFPVVREQAKKMTAIVVIAKDPLPVGGRLGVRPSFKLT